MLKKWRSEIILFGLAAIVIVLDQLTKNWVLNNLRFQDPWNPIEWMAPIVTLTRVHNTGAAFGMFPAAKTFFTIIPVVVIIAILLYYRRFPEGMWLVRIPLGLQLGGAIGNFIDRLRLGYVVDFVDFHFWPVFNVADSSLVVGSLLLAYIILFKLDDEALEGVTAEAESS